MLWPLGDRSHEVLLGIDVIVVLCVLSSSSLAAVL